MLSYAEIGAAAMLSRAAPDRSVDGRLLAAGIGACRAAGDDQADPARDWAHRRAGAERASMTPTHDAADSRNHPARRGARAALRRRRCPIERTERDRHPRGARPRHRARGCRRQSTCRRSIARAMDGYAVIAADTFGASAFEPKTLDCIETVFTGQVARARVTRGTCIEIATGAPLPDGADAVVMVEETEKGSRARRPRADARVPAAARRPARRRHHGRPVALLARRRPERRAASARSRRSGLTEVDVFARPRVAILSTGNEIVEPGQPLAPGQLYDINQFTLGVDHRRARRHRRGPSDGRRQPRGARPTRSRPRRATTCSSSQAEARSASAISSST